MVTTSSVGFERQDQHLRAMSRQLGTATLHHAGSADRSMQHGRRRRQKVEMLFAHLKQQLGIRRLRLRGLQGAAEEFNLAAAVQNLS